VLETLLDRGCTLVATTHHGELKVFAHNDPRLRNASVEFDLETLSPTYHLTVGLPGQSNALAIARRLGLPEQVLERASEQLAPEHFEFETLLGEIRSERAAATEARHREELARREAEELRRALAERRDRIEQERSGILDDARREAEDTLARLRREVEAAKRRTATREFDAAAAGETLRAMDRDVERLAAQAKPRRAEIEAPVTVRREVEPGDLVHVGTYPSSAKRSAPSGKTGASRCNSVRSEMKVYVDRIDRIEVPTPAGRAHQGPDGAPGGCRTRPARQRAGGRPRTVRNEPG